MEIMWQELKYNLKLIGTFITGRLAIAGGVALAVANNISVSFVPFIAVPLGTGLMAILTKMTYDQDNQRIIDFYRDEVAGKKGIPPRQVTLQQTEEVANNNPVLHEVLLRNNRKKLVSLFAHGAAALTAVAAAALLTGVLAPVTMAVVAGLSCYAISGVFEKIGIKIFELHAPTTHERIQQLAQLKQQQGGKLVQAQVMDIFVQANPGLAREIKARFGQPFDQLTAAQTRVAVEEYGPRLNLAQLTDDLNTERVRITSLAFIAAGQEPGVKRLEEAPVSNIEKAKLATMKAMQASKEKASDVLAKSKTMVNHAADKVKMAFSRVDRVSAAPAQPTIELAPAQGGFVERENARRENAAFQGRG